MSDRILKLFYIVFGAMYLVYDLLLLHFLVILTPFIISMFSNGVSSPCLEQYVNTDSFRQA